MRNRHFTALLLGIAPIVAIGQLASAQPAGNDADHQNMDHSTMNHADTNSAAPAAGSNTAAETANTVDATPATEAAPDNASDDAPPQ